MAGRQVSLTGDLGEDLEGYPGIPGGPSSEEDTGWGDLTNEDVLYESESDDDGDNEALAEVDEDDDDDEDAESDVEDDEDDNESSLGNQLHVGRRHMAMRARNAQSYVNSPRTEAYGQGYEAGYVQALQDAGVDPDLVREAYGGLLKKMGHEASRVLSAASRGLLGGKTPSEALLGGKKLTQVAEEAGTSLRESIEADGATLPPVYVEDEEGYEEDLEEDESLAFADEGPDLFAEDEFGRVAKYGFVGGQHRRRARDAAHRAVQKGQSVLAATKPGKPAPFVEDAYAEPVLHDSGRITEPVYGEMVAVPCPSCTRTADRFAGRGAAENCVVCTQYGAILVPKADLPRYAGATSFGFLPLFTTAMSAAAPEIVKQISKGSLFPKAGEKLKEWLETAKKAKISSIDPEVEEEEEVDTSEFESYGIARALVPRGWEARSRR